MQKENKLNLPPDLFNPSRMPERDKNGFVCHPDHDLIYEQLGIDDEGEAAGKLILSLGYEFHFIHMQDEAPGELIEAYFDGETNISAWLPSQPSGDNWQLLCIYDDEDGPVAAYARKKLA